MNGIIIYNRKCTEQQRTVDEEETGSGVAHPCLVGSVPSVGVGRKQDSEWLNHAHQKVHRATEDS